MKPIVTSAVVVIAIVAAASIASAQSRPDFSGSWKPESTSDAPPPPPPPPETLQPGGPPPPPPPPSTVAMTIRQTANQVFIDRTMNGPAPSVITNGIYKLDGTASVNQSGSMVTTTEASWEGTTLVLTTSHSFDGTKIGNSTETYRLEGEKLIVERVLHTPRGAITGTGVFIRGSRD